MDDLYTQSFFFFYRRIIHFHGCIYGKTIEK